MAHQLIDGSLAWRDLADSKAIRIVIALFGTSNGSVEFLKDGVHDDQNS